MNLSRFVGATSREALRQVRLALGPDALIVSNRRVNGGVEIMASDATSAPAVLPEPEVGPHPEAPSVMGAIEAMRGALEARLDEAVWGNQLRQAPQAARLFRSLLGLGFSTALLRAMLGRLPSGMGHGAAMRWVRDELAAHLPVLAREDDLWKPGLALALVGPTGVGKTTTVAKLAARCVRRSGPEGLALVTTDTYRIGAHEQLKLYGDMLQVPVHVVRNADELRHVLEAVSPARTVIIDNVGVSQRDRYVAEQAAMLAKAGRRVSRLLVLNASSHGDTLDEVARTYTSDGGGALAGCIITKVDEAPRIAPALDTAIRYRLPIHYVSDGQRVPENLQHRPPLELVDQALACSGCGRELYAPSEADFAALLTLADARPERPQNSQAARRARFLPRLLASDDGGLPSAEALRRACDRLDDVPACAEAFELWRSWVDDPSGGEAAAASRHLLRSATGPASATGTPLAVLHGRTRLDLPDGVQGELEAAAVFDAGMAGATVPALQLALAHSWQSAWGEASLARPSAIEALMQRVEWLERGAQGASLVHLLRGVSPSLARRLAAGGHAWLASCAARTTVVADACAGPVAALAHDLEFRSVAPGPGLLPGCEPAAGGAGSGVWVAHKPVHLSRRSDAGSAVTALLVRRLDDGGAGGRILCGLTHARTQDAHIDLLAGWLVAMDDAKSAFRHIGGCWKLLADARSASAPSLLRALIAAQTGLATWQAGHDDVLAPVLRGLAAGRPVSPATLLRLFALKEVSSREDGVSR